MIVKKVITLEEKEIEVINSIYEEFDNEKEIFRMKKDVLVNEDTFEIMNLILDSKEKRANIELDVSEKIRSKIEYIFLNNRWFYVFLNKLGFFSRYSSKDPLNEFGDKYLEERMRYRWSHDSSSILLVLRPYGLVELDADYLYDWKYYYKNSYKKYYKDPLVDEYKEFPNSFLIPKLYMDFGDSEVATIGELSKAQADYLEKPSYVTNHKFVRALNRQESPAIMDALLMHDGADHPAGKIIIGRLDRMVSSSYEFNKSDLIFFYFKLLMEAQKDLVLQEYGFCNEIYDAAKRCKFLDKNIVDYTLKYKKHILQGESQKNFVRRQHKPDLNPLYTNIETPSVIYLYEFKAKEDWPYSSTSGKGLDLNYLKNRRLLGAR